MGSGKTQQGNERFQAVSELTFYNNFLFPITVLNVCTSTPLLDVIM